MTPWTTSSVSIEAKGAGAMINHQISVFPNTYIQPPSNLWCSSSKTSKRQSQSLNRLRTVSMRLHWSLRKKLTTTSRRTNPLESIANNPTTHSKLCLCKLLNKLLLSIKVVLHLHNGHRENSHNSGNLFSSSMFFQSASINYLGITFFQEMTHKR